MDGDLAKQHCWIHGSSHIPAEFRNELSKVDCISKEEDEYDTLPDTAYYQWVVFVLVIQAGIFAIPYRIWKQAEHGLIKEFNTGEVNKVLVLEDDAALHSAVKRYVRQFNSILHHNNRYFATFVLCEVFNIVVLYLNFWLTNAFLGYKFGNYGFAVLNYYGTDPHVVNSNQIVNPMCNLFPTKVSCNMKTVGDSGALQTHNGLCILSQNIVNEKIFLAIYFWYVFLMIVSGIYAFFRACTILVPQLRERYMCSKIRGRHLNHCVRNILKHSYMGDWFVLMQIAKNVNPYFFREFVMELARDIVKADSNGLDADPSDRLILNDDDENLEMNKIPKE